MTWTRLAWIRSAAVEALKAVIGSITSRLRGYVRAASLITELNPCRLRIRLKGGMLGVKLEPGKFCRAVRLQVRESLIMIRHGGLTIKLRSPNLGGRRRIISRVIIQLDGDWIEEIDRQTALTPTFREERIKLVNDRLREREKRIELITAGLTTLLDAGVVLVICLVWLTRMLELSSIECKLVLITLAIVLRLIAGPLIRCVAKKRIKRYWEKLQSSRGSATN